MESVSGSKSVNGNGSKQGIGSTAQDFAHDMKQKGVAMKDEAMETGKKFGSQVATTVEGAISKVGDELSSYIPSEGVIKDAASKVVEGIKAGTDYVQKKNVTEMKEDLTQAVRSYPFGFMIAGVAVGYLLGVACKSKH